MPQNQMQARSRRNRRRRRLAAAITRGAGAPGGGKPSMPLRTPPGVEATPKPGVPVGEPVPKDVRQIGGGGPPRSTLPREGSLGYQFGNRALIERLQKAAGGEKLGAYNLTHRKGEPIAALAARRKARSRRPKKRKGLAFGGPDDGRAVRG